MKKRYSGYDDAFSAVEFGMRKLGMWPLETNDPFYDNVRWCLVTTMNLLIAMHLLTEICMGCGDASNTLEGLLIFNASIHGICNCIFPKMYRKKIAKNINAAMEDWLDPSTIENEESRAIMRFYGRASKFIGMGQLIVGLLGIFLYVTSILLLQTYQIDTRSNGTISRSYILPVNCFIDSVSYTKYKVIIFVQTLQGLHLLITQWAIDTFFFTIVLHLCGQLDILKIRLTNFIEKERATRSNSWEEFNVFVRRHCHLINLADNLEDTFNLSIMIQLLMNVFLIALAGFKFILYVKSHDSVEMLKSIIFIKFTILQSFIYTCAGDLLGGHSEDMFHTLWQAPWYDLPSPMIKSFSFVMMRSKKPLRISAGKFVYISRITLMDIMRAAASYISFLQITI